MEIYLFNPEHDLALANGTPLYTPTPTARRMRGDLELLPVWYAEKGSLILVQEKERCAEWLERWNKSTGKDIGLITKKELRGLVNAEFEPWGWNAALRRELLKAGVAESCLPSEERLAAYREMSHRRISIDIHRKVKEQGLKEVCAEEPCELDSVERVMQYAREHPGCYLKMPYSGSGRGIYHVIDKSNRALEQWCAGAIRSQGSLLCEPGYAKIRDFAAEFYCAAGRSSFLGYSVFETDFHSQFRYGVVASQTLLKRLLMIQGVNVERAVQAVQKAIDELITPHYEGYVGVDMILYEDETGEARVNPCVEVNLRATMGVVTCGVARLKKMGGTRIGEFYLSQMPYLGYEEKPLVPVHDKTRYVAVMR